MENQGIQEIQALDQVIKTTITTVESSQDQIFEIAEAARIEGNKLKKELEDITLAVTEVIKRHDELQLAYTQSRKRLMEVSKDFHHYSEPDIRTEYERASKIQIELQLTREREQNLRERRDDLQLRLKNLEQTLKRAEDLMSQMTLVAEYLKGDITQMSAELEAAKYGHLYGIKIIEAQEEERKRVAREIHDGPAQSLANVVLRADIVEKMLIESRIKEALIEVRDVKKIIRNSLVDVRKLIYNLRPMALDDLGLIPALRKLIEGHSLESGFKVQFDLHGAEKRLNSTLEVAVYRLIQECFNNISKHANASKVWVSVEYKQDFLNVVVKDNGTGFQSNQKMKRTHFGLMGMKERVKLLEGVINIASHVGEGTKIEMEIPLAPKKSNEPN